MEFSRLNILAWTAVVAAAISMFATPALSQEASGALDAPKFKACLQAQGSSCRLIAHAIGIQIAVGDGDALIAYIVPSSEGFRIDRQESVNQDMEALVLDGSLSPDDAAYAFAEILTSHDLAYRIPGDARALKAAVNFPPQAVLTPQDQVDVIASHLQMTLGVSAVTADYLVMKLGLEIVDPAQMAPNLATTNQTTDQTTDQEPQSPVREPASNPDLTSNQN